MPADERGRRRWSNWRCFTFNQRKGSNGRQEACQRMDRTAPIPAVEEAVVMVGFVIPIIARKVTLRDPKCCFTIDEHMAAEQRENPCGLGNQEEPK
jgi:hypothetical protein